MNCRCGATIYRDNAVNVNQDWACMWCLKQICGFCHGKHNATVHPNETAGPKPYRHLTWRDIRR